jgi:hypothetical protein
VDGSLRDATESVLAGVRTAVRLIGEACDLALASRPELELRAIEVVCALEPTNTAAKCSTLRAIREWRVFQRPFMERLQALCAADPTVEDPRVKVTYRLTSVDADRELSLHPNPSDPEHVHVLFDPKDTDYVVALPFSAGRVCLATRTSVVAVCNPAEAMRLALVYMCAVSDPVPKSSPSAAANSVNEVSQYFKGGKHPLKDTADPAVLTERLLWIMNGVPASVAGTRALCEGASRYLGRDYGAADLFSCFVSGMMIEASGDTRATMVSDAKANTGPSVVVVQRVQRLILDQNPDPDPDPATTTPAQAPAPRGKRAAAAPPVPPAAKVHRTSRYGHIVCPPHQSFFVPLTELDLFIKSCKSACHIPPFDQFRGIAGAVTELPAVAEFLRVYRLDGHVYVPPDSFRDDPAAPKRFEFVSSKLHVGSDDESTRFLAMSDDQWVSRDAASFTAVLVRRDRAFFGRSGGEDTHTVTRAFTVTLPPRMRETVSRHDLARYKLFWLLNDVLVRYVGYLGPKLAVMGFTGPGDIANRFSNVASALYELICGLHCTLWFRPAIDPPATLTITVPAEYPFNLPEVPEAEALTETGAWPVFRTDLLVFLQYTIKRWGPIITGAVGELLALFTGQERTRLVAGHAGRWWVRLDPTRWLGEDRTMKKDLGASGLLAYDLVDSSRTALSISPDAGELELIEVLKRPGMLLAAMAAGARADPASVQWLKIKTERNGFEVQYLPGTDLYDAVVSSKDTRGLFASIALEPVLVRVQPSGDDETCEVRAVFEVPKVAEVAPLPAHGVPSVQPSVQPSAPSAAFLGPGELAAMDVEPGQQVPAPSVTVTVVAPSAQPSAQPSVAFVRPVELAAMDVEPGQQAVPEPSVAPRPPPPASPTPSAQPSAAFVRPEVLTMDVEPGQQAVPAPSAPWTPSSFIMPVCDRDRFEVVRVDRCFRNGEWVDIETNYQVQLRKKEKVEMVASRIIKTRFAAVEPMLKEEVVEAALALLQLPALPDSVLMAAEELRPLVSGPSPLIWTLEHTPDEKMVEMRQTLLRVLHRLESLRGVGKSPFPGPIGLAVSHLVVALGHITELSRHNRIMLNTFAARSLNKAKGELTRAFNQRVRQLLANPDFRPNDHFQVRMDAAEVEAGQVADDYFAGAKSWRTKLEVSSRIPRAERALRVSRRHVSAAIANDALERLRPAGDGRAALSAKPSTFIDLAVCDKVPVPFTFARDIISAMQQSQPGKGFFEPAAALGEQAAQQQSGSKRDNLKDKLAADPTKFLNPVAKAKPRHCLCGRQFVSGDKSRRYEIEQDVPGGAFRQSIHLRVSRPDGASCGECCRGSQKVLFSLPRSSSSSSPSPSSSSSSSSSSAPASSPSSTTTTTTTSASSTSTSSSTSKPKDISGNQSPSSATFPPLFSRLGILATQEIRRRMMGGG